MKRFVFIHKKNRRQIYRLETGESTKQDSKNIIKKQGKFRKPFRLKRFIVLFKTVNLNVERIKIVINFIDSTTVTCAAD